MDIIFSINNNESVKVIPVPAEVEISEPQDNGEFDTLNGKLSVIGPMGPRSFPLTSYFPNRPGVKVRPGASTDGWSYVEWFEECRKRKLPMRVIIIYDSGYTVNMACLINDFKWSVGTNKDIKYSMDVVEYTFALSKKLEETTTDNTGEDDDQVKWDEFAASEEYAFLQRLVRRSKEEEASSAAMAEAVEKAVEAGFTTGERPQDRATREEVMSMIVNMHEL